MVNKILTLKFTEHFVHKFIHHLNKNLALRKLNAEGKPNMLLRFLTAKLEKNGVIYFFTKKFSTWMLVLHKYLNKVKRLGMVHEAEENYLWKNIFLNGRGRSLSSSGRPLLKESTVKTGGGVHIKNLERRQPKGVVSRKNQKTIDFMWLFFKNKASIIISLFKIYSHQWLFFFSTQCCS